MSIVDEINKDLEKMGGDTSGNTLEEAMDKFGDKIIEEIGEATELPAVTSEDEGDVLMVDSEGKWAKGEIPSQLPEVETTDEGKVLTVNSEGVWGADNVPTELPEVIDEDEHKVLTVVAVDTGEVDEDEDPIYAYEWKKDRVFDDLIIRGEADASSFTSVTLNDESIQISDVVRSLTGDKIIRVRVEGIAQGPGGWNMITLGNYLGGSVSVIGITTAGYMLNLSIGSSSITVNEYVDLNVE